MRTSALVALAALATLGAATPAHAAFPGKPGRIAFSTDVVPGTSGAVTTGAEIWTANADNTDFKRLTTNDVSISDAEPAWSPGGQHIAFVSNRSGTNQIYTMRQNGSDVRALTRGTRPAGDPAWSPGGVFVVFARGGDLWITTAAGFPTWRLTRTPGVEEAMPAWSPLGLRIAYVVDPFERDASVWTIRIDGRDARNLTAVTAGAGADDSAPDYTPDGRRITFTSHRENLDQSYGAGVWTMRADGSEPIQLVEGEYHGGIGEVSVSPDGSRFVASHCNNHSCSLPIFTHPVDGSAAAYTGAAVFDPNGDAFLVSGAWQPLR